MRCKLYIIILLCVVGKISSAQSHMYQLLYDKSIKTYNVDAGNSTFQSSNSSSLDVLMHVFKTETNDNMAFLVGPSMDLGLKFYDFTNAHISKTKITRFEFGAGVSTSFQSRFKGFYNGLTVSAIPVLLFSGWTWGDRPRMGLGVKLSADVNINFVNIGICYYPFKQKVHTEGHSYFFQPNMQFRIGLLILGLED